MSHEFETELTADRNEITAMLNSVIDGITAGSLQFNTGDEDLTINVPEELSLEIELETEDDDLSLELELEWPQPEIEIDESAEDRREEDNVPAVSVGDANVSGTFARFEVFRDRSDEWRWRLRHRNGNVIATSGEGYTRKHNAQKGLQSVIRNAQEAEIIEDTEK